MESGNEVGKVPARLRHGHVLGNRNARRLLEQLHRVNAAEVLFKTEYQGGAFCFVFVKPELAGIDTLEATIETVIDDYRERTGDHTNIRIKIEL